MHLPVFIVSRLLAPVWYLHQQPLLLRAPQEPVPVRDPDRDSCRTLILAKSHYHETLHEFPFSNLKEILEAVHMDLSSYSPFESQLILIRKLPTETTGARVNLWFIRAEASALIAARRPRLVLPETALASLGLPTGLYAARRFGGTLCFFVRPDSGVESLLTETSSREFGFFQRGLGRGAVDLNPAELPDYVDTLFHTLHHQPLSAFQPFFQLPAPITLLKNRSLRWGGAVILLILLVFAAGWVTLPLKRLQHLEAHNHRLDQTLGGLLEQQAELDRNYQIYTQLHGILTSYQPRIPFFNHLSEALPADVLISQLTISGSQVEIRGTADQASDVLRQLNTVPFFQSAAFSAPLRKDQRTQRDVFTITLEFVADLAPAN